MTIKLNIECDECSKNESDVFFNYLCDGCLENRFTNDEIKECILAQYNATYRHNENEEVGGCTAEEAKLFMQGFKRGYRSALFWSAEYFGLDFEKLIKDVKKDD